MILEYKSETSLRVRVIYLLLLPFVALIASVLIFFFGLFDGDSYELVASIIAGDLTRLVDFFGYLAVVTVVIGCSGALIFGLIFHGLIKTNHVAEIVPKSRKVVIRYYSPWPWHRYRTSTYRFDELVGLNLSYDDEQSKVLLYLPDRKRPLALVSEQQWHVAQQKFNRLKEIGLPSH